MFFQDSVHTKKKYHCLGRERERDGQTETTRATNSVLLEEEKVKTKKKSGERMQKYRRTERGKKQGEEKSQVVIQKQ